MNNELINLVDLKNKLEFLSGYEFEIRNGFWCDKKHMENMLGLHPKDGYGDNCYSKAENPENYVELLVLNTYYKQECKEILSRAQEFTKAGIKIKLFYKEPKWAKKGK